MSSITWNGIYLDGFSLGPGDHDTVFNPLETSANRYLRISIQDQGLKASRFDTTLKEAREYHRYSDVRHLV